MDNLTKRAANIAANKLLAAAGYDPKGLTLAAAARKKLAAKRARKSETLASQKAARKKNR